MVFIASSQGVSVKEMLVIVSVTSGEITMFTPASSAMLAKAWAKVMSLLKLTVILASPSSFASSAGFASSTFFSDSSDLETEVSLTADPSGDWALDLLTGPASVDAEDAKTKTPKLNRTANKGTDILRTIAPSFLPPNRSIIDLNITHSNAF